MNKKWLWFGGIFLALFASVAIWIGVSVWSDVLEVVGDGAPKVADTDTTGDKATDDDFPKLYVVNSDNPEKDQKELDSIGSFLKGLNPGPNKSDGEGSGNNDPPNLEVTLGIHSPDFDMDAIGKTIKLNGVPIPLPGTTLNDLGSEYDFEEMGVEDDGLFFTGLECFGTRRAGVTLESPIDDPIARRDVPIVGISSDFMFGSDIAWVLEVDGIKVGDSIEKVLAKYGEPDEKRKSDFREYKQVNYSYKSGNDILYFDTNLYYAKKNFNSDNPNTIVDIMYINYQKR